MGTRLGITGSDEHVFYRHLFTLLMSPHYHHHYHTHRRGGSLARPTSPAPTLLIRLPCAGCAVIDSPVLGGLEVCVCLEQRISRLELVGVNHRGLLQLGIGAVVRLRQSDSRVPKARPHQDTESSSGWALDMMSDAE